jgi:hypothetical protein
MSISKKTNEVVKDTEFFRKLRSLITPITQKIELKRWADRGESNPPPHIIKQQIIIEYAKKYNIHNFVETGTYRGDMLAKMRKHFKNLYSIELSEYFYSIAIRRFAKEERIKIIHGDSGRVLGQLISDLNGPALFWLDGHYSAGNTAKGEKDTPVLEELTSIFNDRRYNHVIIIDDARCFGSIPAYPSLNELNEFIKEKCPNATVKIETDSIRITPAMLKKP